MDRAAWRLDVPTTRRPGVTWGSELRSGKNGRRARSSGRKGAKRRKAHGPHEQRDSRHEHDENRQRRGNGGKGRMSGQQIAVAARAHAMVMNIQRWRGRRGCRARGGDGFGASRRDDQLTGDRHQHDQPDGDHAEPGSQSTVGVRTHPGYGKFCGASLARGLARDREPGTPLTAETLRRSAPESTWPQAPCSPSRSATTAAGCCIPGNSRRCSLRVFHRP